jgi:multidrug efflux system membrane fusion protein
VTDDNRKDKDQAQAKVGVQTAQPSAPPQLDSSQQHEHEENQHDESLRKPKPLLGWLLLAFVVLLASVVVLTAVGRAVENPRTDDAEVFANFIGMAPQVDGPIMQLPIRDNQYVKAGDLLFVVDERPYRYALERALSQQSALEGQIEDRQRSINSQISSVHVAQANIASNNSNRDALNATISEAEANLADSRAAVLRAEADRKYAADNLHRLEPLLDQQFVTVDQVEQARTLLETRTRAVEQATAQVALSEAHVRTTRSHYQQSGAEVEQSEAQREQAANGVETLAPLTNQREERAAAIRTARYNLNNCRVYAPFDGFITNLTTSVGEYVHTGTQVFTMIDSRVWWVVANFRETQLNHVTLGSPADLFLMSHENLPLRGVVESIGHGVTPDPGVAGVISPGLPAIERSLSWVHLAARYPVRIRIESPPSSLLRIGETAVAVVHPVRGSAR